MRVWLLWILLGCSACAGSISAPMAVQGAGTGGDGGTVLAGDAGATFDAGPVDVEDAGQRPDAGATPDAGSLVDAGAPELNHFIGRMDTSDPAGPSFSWSGSAVLTRFEGSELRVTLSNANNNQFQVVVDGQPTQVLKGIGGGSHEVTLATGLSSGRHDVVLYRRTEPSFGPVQFLGFTTTPANGQQAIPYPVQRRMELIGDSISCGYGDEGDSVSCHFSADTENEYLSYGPLTARALGAELHTIAWSGKGVYQNYGGDKDELMPELYQRLNPTDPSSQWTFPAPHPDVVVINLGTNDFYAGDPGTQFKTAYQALVTLVRSKHPDATIFCAVGPMINDPTAIRGYLQSIVSTANAAGDTRVHYVEFAVQDVDADGGGCDYHPSLKTHQKMAAVLQGAIHTVMGW